MRTSVALLWRLVLGPRVHASTRSQSATWKSINTDVTARLHRKSVPSTNYNNICTLLTELIKLSGDLPKVATTDQILGERFPAPFADTKIHGDPTFMSLTKPEEECKANGKSVSSTLGSGIQRHLDLVNSIAACECISPGAPFVPSLLPVLRAAGFRARCNSVPDRQSPSDFLW